MFECETKDTPIVKKNPNVVKADCIYLRGGTCMKYEAVGTLEVNGDLLAMAAPAIDPK